MNKKNKRKNERIFSFFYVGMYKVAAQDAWVYLLRIFERVIQTLRMHHMIYRKAVKLVSAHILQIGKLSFIIAVFYSIRWSAGVQEPEKRRNFSFDLLHQCQKSFYSAFLLPNQLYPLLRKKLILYLKKGF